MNLLQMVIVFEVMLIYFLKQLNYIIDSNEFSNLAVIKGHDNRKNSRAFFTYCICISRIHKSSSTIQTVFSKKDKKNEAIILNFQYYHYIEIFLEQLVLKGPCTMYFAPAVSERLLKKNE